MEREIDDADEVWRATLATVREQVTAKQYEVWFRHTRAGAVRGGRIDVLVPNLHARDFLERNYTSLVKTAVTQNTGWHDPQVRFVLDDEKPG